MNDTAKLKAFIMALDAAKKTDTEDFEAWLAAETYGGDVACMNDEVKQLMECLFDMILA